MKYPQIVACLVTGTIGCIFILIGESTPQWITYGSTLTAGLFTACGVNGCVSYIAEGGIIPAKAFVVIGFLTSAAGLIVLIVYYCKHLRNDTTHKILSMVTAVLFIIAAVASLIGPIIFATSGKSLFETAFERKMDLGYSFALTIVGAIITAIAGALALIHRLGLQN
ncbi:unnamed protein product [Candidula unifasciata]|uniref:Uncharacterized protein n=1 Tax=Candidula unifasciata TaxID=100452 RepID=A0A8S3YWS3_9EUPU|nr:unnamed protein product [Candidula unifasciata]